MKDWSTTKKIVVAFMVLALLALAWVSISNYSKEKRLAEQERISNRMAEKSLDDDMTGDQLSRAIRSNLANQPVSEIGVKFYQS